MPEGSGRNPANFTREVVRFHTFLISKAALKVRIITFSKHVRDRLWRRHKTRHRNAPYPTPTRFVT
jgi:hypothetical protein